MKQFFELTMTEVAEALIKQELPNGKKISIETARDGLARVIPMLEDSIKGLEAIDDSKINHIIGLIAGGKEFLR